MSDNNHSKFPLNKIKLGVSSVNLRQNYMSKSNSSYNINRHDDLSVDLDNIYLNNLKLLKEEQSKPTVSQSTNNLSQIDSSVRYQSSVNIFIKPKETWRHSSIVDYSFCEVIPIKDSRNRSQNNNLQKSSLSSSYEILYDKLLNKTNHNDDDSDKTLKSSAPSSISSIDSEEVDKSPVITELKRNINIKPPLPKYCTSENPSNIIISRPLGNSNIKKSYPNHPSIHFNDKPQQKTQYPPLQLNPPTNILNNIFQSGKVNGNQNYIELNNNDHPPSVPQRKKRTKIANQYFTKKDNIDQTNQISTNQSNNSSNKNSTNFAVVNGSNFTKEKTVSCKIVRY